MSWLLGPAGLAAVVEFLELLKLFELQWLAIRLLHIRKYVCMYVCMSVHDVLVLHLGRLPWDVCVQWNLSIVDTIGTQLAVLYREVSLIQK